MASDVQNRALRNYTHTRALVIFAAPDAFTVRRIVG